MEFQSSFLPQSLTPAYRLEASTFAERRPTYKLYDDGSFLCASILGGPIVVSGLIALNFKRLGRSSDAWLAVLGGVSMTAVSIGLSDVPYMSPGVAGVLIAMGCYRIAKNVQREEIEAHLEAGGDFESRWRAFGFAIAFLAVICLGIFGYVYGTTKPQVALGEKGQVFYSGSVTKTQAEAVATQLRDQYHFGKSAATVYLSKEANGTEISFVVREGSWNDDETIRDFGEIARAVSPDVGGLPVTVRLLNSQSEPEKQQVIQ